MAPIVYGSMLDSTNLCPYKEGVLSCNNTHCFDQSVYIFIDSSLSVTVKLNVECGCPCDKINFTNSKSYDNATD